MTSLLRSLFFLSPFVPNISSPPSTGNTNSEPDVGGQTYDYIVVGGGLTGLTVANRLSEDSGRELIPLDMLGNL